MNRLGTELERLFLGGLVFAPDDAQALSLVDVRQRTRTLVLEVVQPANWEALSEVWQGVQMELELPAPGIAVSGSDGLQLWFPLETAIAVGQAHAFLAALRERFLDHLPAARVRLWPTPDGRHTALVPAAQSDGNWSAFVAPDLAAVFSETPWLDVEPGEEGQAALLRTLQTIKPAAFDAALVGMRPAARHAPAREPAPVAHVDSDDDPRRFLLRVMNDETVPLALRIEAAKALLPKA